MILIRKSDNRVSTLDEADLEICKAFTVLHIPGYYFRKWHNLVQYMENEDITSFIDAATELSPNFDLYDEVAAWLEANYRLG